MGLEMTGSVESGNAHLTHRRSLSSVLVRVNCQVSFFGETKTADSTRIRFEFGVVLQVDALVALQLTGRFEA